MTTLKQYKNDRLLRAIWRQPVDRTPIWLMRQAGRYLPEYRATRARAGNFMRLCKTPELACEVTLQPLKRFPLDAAIIFSDILTIPDAMGLGLEVIEQKGPIFHHPLRSSSDIQKLMPPDLAQLEYVYQAIQLVERELKGKVPLIGFCGSPFTLSAYMIEGESKPQFPLIRKMLHDEPLLLHHLLEKLAISVAAHLNAQIKAGVQAVMIFDTWGGLLNLKEYEIFSLNYIKQILHLLSDHQNKIPVILFTKGGKQFLELMAGIGCDALGVDWEISLQEARERVGAQVALQGNMNPHHLLQTPEVIYDQVKQILASYGSGSGHIFNLGHGINKEATPEHVKILVEAVHELSPAYHQ